jgi:hypothetical protein
MNDRNLVSYIVITHNRKQMLLACLRTVTAQVRQQPAEIIVVDNASDDGTAEAVGQEFPDATLVCLESNDGPGAARNAGIEKARGDILIFIDDDAEFVSSDVSATVISRFAGEPDLAIVAFRIINAYTNQAMRYDFSGADLTLADQEFETTWFVGCGFALRKQVLLSTGPFFVPFFYGAEELDLCYRVLDAGFRVRYLPSVTVRHHKPAKRDVTARYLRYDVRSRFLVAWRNLPWWAALSYTTLWSGYLFLQAMKQGLLGSYLRGLLAGFASLPLALGTRKVIKPDTVRRLRALHGRLFY